MTTHDDMITRAHRRLRSFRSDLRFPGAPAVVAGLVDEARAFAAAMRALVGREQTVVLESYRQDHGRWFGYHPRVATPVNQARGVLAERLGAFAAVVLECAFAALLAALTFNLSLVAAAVTGVLITIAVTLVTKGAYRIFAASVERPQKAVRDLYLQVTIIFPIWVLSLAAVLMIGRNITEATPMLNFVFGALMTLLTVTTPLLAGALLVSAELRDWASPHVRRWDALDALVTDLDELGRFCRVVEARVSGLVDLSPAALPPSTIAEVSDDTPEASVEEAPAVAADSATTPLVRVARTAAALSVLVGVAWLPAAASGQARSAIWIDTTTSVAAEPLQQTLDEVLDLVPRVADATGVRQWDLLAFAGGAYSARPFATITVPASPDAPCTTAASTRSEIEIIFRTTATTAAEREDAACARVRREALDGYRDALAQQGQAARTALAAVVPDDPRRTCLVDLFHRVSEARPGTLRAVVVLSDGVETCEPQMRDPIPAPAAPGVTTVMVVVPEQDPRNGRTTRQHVAAMQEFWGRLAPWVEVVATHAVTDLFVPARKP